MLTKKEIQQRYYQKHREEILAKRKAEYNPDKNKIYRLENKEKIAAKNARWYEKNKDTIIPKQVEYQRDRKKDPEYADMNRQARRNYYQTHKDEIKQYRDNYRTQNKEKMRLQERLRSRKRQALINQNSSKVTLGEIKKLIKDSNNICFWCDKEVPEGKIHLDHIYPLSKGGTHTIDNIVIACATCNIKKNDKDPEIWVEQVLQQPRHSLMSVS
jgi:5-methylcytosine-specific restriction endonuclease McrA